MIEVENLVKRYGDKVALDNVSFKVDKGEILGFLGPNGAGKSTTMNIITGYISSNEGTVNIDGYEILKDPIKAKSRIGYLPEIPPLYLDMTVKGYLSFMFDLKKIKLTKQEHIKEICEMVKISDVYDRLIKNLSKGYKQRVGLAYALLGNPPLLILDEPTVGLDPKQIIEIRNLIKSFAEKYTVILSSHVLSEIQAICNRVIVINKGKIVADDTTENLSAKMKGKDTFLVQVEGNKDDVINVLNSVEIIVNVDLHKQNDDGTCEYIIESEKDKGQEARKLLFSLLSEHNMPILSLQDAKMNLEDIFIKLTEIDSLEENQLVLDQHNNEESINNSEVSLEDNEENGGEQE